MNIHPQTMTMIIILLLCNFLVTTSVASHPMKQIHLIMPHSGSAGCKHYSGLDCLSWRLAVETNNIQNWKQVPLECEAYVGHYMLGEQYRKDCDLVAAEAYEYAKGLNVSKDGKDVWVFDIDETTLSNIPYYARDTVQFGALPYNSTAFNAWVDEAVAPPIPGSLELYKGLVELGFKIVFITGSHDTHTEPRARNLNNAGYTTWEKLILKGNGDGHDYKANKRKELEEGGYKIRGNMGDQWSDLIGSNPGDRTFKVPDPMYYIA